MTKALTPAENLKKNDMNNNKFCPFYQANSSMITDNSIPFHCFSYNDLIFVKI